VRSLAGAPAVRAPYGEWRHDSPAEIMEEIAALTPIYGGVSHAGWPRGPAVALSEPGVPALGSSTSRPFPAAAPAHSGSAPRPAESPDGRVSARAHHGRVSSTTIREPMTVACRPRLAGAGGGGGRCIRVMRSSARSRRAGPCGFRSRRGAVHGGGPRIGRHHAGHHLHAVPFTEAAANVLTHAALDPVAQDPGVQRSVRSAVEAASRPRRAGPGRAAVAEPGPLALDRAHAVTCSARCCSSGASRRRRPSSTPWARSAASSTSTSARRRGVGACRRAHAGGRVVRPTGSTARRWRGGSRPAR